MGPTTAASESAPMLSLCVVIPMFNEEANAERCVRAIAPALEQLPCGTGFLVVNDGSEDRTDEILADLGDEYPILQVVAHERNSGYGASVRTGIAVAAAAGFDYALFMDSDLTNDPKYLPDFLRKLEEGYDIVKASRYIPGGGMEGVPPHRVWISVVGNKLASWLMGLPLSDCTNGYRAVRLDLLVRMPLAEHGFAVIMEEAYYARFLGARVGEIPYILTSRVAESGESKFRYRPRIFWEYLKYLLKAGLRIRPRLEPADPGSRCPVDDPLSSEPTTDEHASSKSRLRSEAR